MDAHARFPEIFNYCAIRVAVSNFVNIILDMRLQGLDRVAVEPKVF